MIPIPIQLLVLIVTGSLAAGFGTGFYTHYKFTQADHVSQVDQAIDTINKDVAIGNTVVSATESAKSDLQVVYRTRTKQVIKYVPITNKNPDCNLNADSVRLLNEAATGMSSTSSKPSN